jgi:hypothetical protein
MCCSQLYTSAEYQHRRSHGKPSCQPSLASRRDFANPQPAHPYAGARRRDNTLSVVAMTPARPLLLPEQTLDAIDYLGNT